MTSPAPTTGAPGLRFDGTVRRAAFAIQVAFSVRPGEVLGVLGPNGAGKSTLLRAIAGLTELSSGSVEIGGHVWQGPDRFVPAEQRRAGVVFQDYRLFPHLDVRDNVSFAARSAGIRRAAARELATDWLQAARAGRSREAPPAPALRWPGATRGAGQGTRPRP